MGSNSLEACFFNLILVRRGIYVGMGFAETGMGKVEQGMRTGNGGRT